MRRKTKVTLILQVLPRGDLYSEINMWQKWCDRSSSTPPSSAGSVRGGSETREKASRGEDLRYITIATFLHLAALSLLSFPFLYKLSHPPSISSLRKRREG